MLGREGRKVRRVETKGGGEGNREVREREKVNEWKEVRRVESKGGGRG